MTVLLRELKKQEEKLFNCVHCGFCVPVCPTYRRLGDEADSPRGRLQFMRALVENRVPSDSSTVRTHLDRCLGCRACESVCPSGVEYGHLLEGAREATSQGAPKGLMERALPAFMANPILRRPIMAMARVLRATGVPALVSERLGSTDTSAQVALGFGMLAATAEPSVLEKLATGEGAWRLSGPAVRADSKKTAEPKFRETAAQGSLGRGLRVGMLTGCVQEGLLGRVNRATERVLEANGFTVVSIREQGCCGAIHAHTGDLEGARDLARGNIEAFESRSVDLIAVNAAGCGASLKEYAHLLDGDPAFGERAAVMAAKVRDVTELLGQPGLATGAPLSVSVTYDAPCHLLHAQRVVQEPLVLLDSIPGLDLRPLANHDECCGGAGIYGITNPELGGAISADKVKAILDTGARIVATGNPGCMMQIGAGLRAAGAPVDVVHPIELLDVSYRRGGLYR